MKLIKPSIKIKIIYWFRKNIFKNIKTIKRIPFSRRYHPGLTNREYEEGFGSVPLGHKEPYGSYHDEK